MSDRDVHKTHDEDRQTVWNRRYAEHSSIGEPSFVLQTFHSFLPQSGMALDIACGTGANSLFMAQYGLDVDAWDFSRVALNRLRREAADSDLAQCINTRCVEIDADVLPPSKYQVIVNCHYLDRSIIPAMKMALAPGGLLFFQTFTANKRVNLGPSKSAFLLAPGELQDLMQGLEILASQDEGTNPDETHPLAGRACIVARQP
jgi:2-polyprenyl-3-methyl-5-hydroxy-6-metoxy-1,4-benzoquinol methylase